MKAMMIQLAVLTQTLVPRPGVQAVKQPLVVNLEVIEIDPPSKFSKKRGHYLSLLEHVSKLGTKHSTSSLDPIVVDEWRSHLLRNFNSTRS